MQDFEIIYQKYRHLVYNLALQYVQNSEDAAEITQDVFVKIYQNLAKFQAQSQLKTWIYRISINTCLDFLKARRTRKRWHFWSAMSLSTTNTDIPHFDHPGVALEQKEALAKIFRCIHQLPEKQKNVLILLKIEQMSQQEVAEILEMSVKAVESLFHRAKKNLALLLENEG
ncbi:MAG: RNA polymerase sigma factor [Chitinophagales bacterium]|nr:RNA polymerase sigma factor [Bacteroidota bacterium]